MMLFSERMSGLKPSAIREILKVTADPTVLSLAAGNPSPETFPKEEMARIAAEIFENHYASALQYGISEGFARLRELTAGRYRDKYNIGKDSDDLIIVSGGQQAIELAAKCLLNEGDAVLCEAPSFIGALSALRSYNVRLVGVPMDEDGMRMDALEDALRSTPRVKLIYTIPTFQNPTGRVLSLERRKEMLRLAAQYDVHILEDSPYFELRYSGEYVPPIKTLDTEGRVLFAGSFSKIIAPGIRLGFLCADKSLIPTIVVAKQVSDVHSNLFFQMLVARYLETCDLDAHIQACVDLYRQKRDFLAAELNKRLGGKLSFDLPDGGLFLWCELPDGQDGFEVCKQLAEKKVAAVPGSAFLTDDTQKSSGIRLNFSLPSEAQMEEAVSRMSEVLG